ncbi:MAG: PAS domain-containing sensor histidine kinase [Leptolyngbyaceae cyanobacterium SM1_3_5]|nr:PAS domain-containing sensor histidine kinase [Leptolyngbyaceae cyanobacterium SM1_3_5]
MRWISDRGQTSIGSDGTRRLCGVIINISKRKAIEQQLRQNEERLRLVLSTTGIRGWIWEIATNRVYRLMPGAIQDGFFGAIEDFYATLHPDDRARIQAAFETSAVTGVDYSEEYRAIENGKTVWLFGRGVILRDEAGRPNCLVGVNVDVSDRRLTEAALRDSESRLRGFVDASVIGILFGDVEGNILDANDELLRIVGYSRADLEAGRLRWLDITPPEYLPLDAERIAEAQERGACTPYEKEYIHKDGTRVPILVGYSLTGEQRQDSVAFILDLSDRKALEQQLRSQADELARANRMKDEFLAVLSHELRTPLNPILGWSQLLKRQSIDSTTLRRGLDTIERNARLQTQLIEDLLDVSSILQGKLNLDVDAIDLAEIVEVAIETVQLAADAKHIALQFTPPAVPVLVSGDGKRLQQVAWNLLSNAVKFTSAGGQVEIWLERSQIAKMSRLPKPNSPSWIRASASTQTFCRICSIASAKPTVRRHDRTAAWDWDWRSCGISSNCMAARWRRQTAAIDRAQFLPCSCHWRSRISR